jgi:hypothetical protein
MVAFWRSQQRARLDVKMKRREFIMLLGGGAAGWPLGARAQPLGKVPTIGFLGSTTYWAWSHWVAAFVLRLRELGWIEGRTVAIEYRWAEARSERYTEIAAEFVRLKVDVKPRSASQQPRQEPFTAAFGVRLAPAFLHDEFNPAGARQLAPHAQGLLQVRVMPEIASALLAHDPVSSIDAGDPDHSFGHDALLTSPRVACSRPLSPGAQVGRNP